VDVTFTKTGSRRHRVTIEREKAPDLIMDPAPGYDAFLPHDLVHFVVERECGLQHGIYGQLAEGDGAGSAGGHPCNSARGRSCRAERRPSRCRLEHELEGDAHGARAR
jgi:hypothetical protein